MGIELNSRSNSRAQLAGQTPIQATPNTIPQQNIPQQAPLMQQPAPQAMTSQFTAPQAQAGGGLQLAKGQKMDLTKGNPGLTSILVGLGWDTNAYGGHQYDLDTTAFLLDASGRVLSQQHVVFYNNLFSPDGAVRHNGDNRTGQGDGDDESVTIQLSQVQQEVQKIVFVVTIDQAMMRGQNFGQVSNAYIRVADVNGTPLCRYDLTEDYSSSISVIVGEVYRHGGEWKFGAIGQGSQLDLGGHCAQFGAI